MVIEPVVKLKAISRLQETKNELTAGCAATSGEARSPEKAQRGSWRAACSEKRNPCLRSSNDKCNGAPHYKNDKIHEPAGRGRRADPELADNASIPAVAREAHRRERHC